MIEIENKKFNKDGIVGLQHFCPLKDLATYYFIEERYSCSDHSKLIKLYQKQKSNLTETIKIQEQKIVELEENYQLIEAQASSCEGYGYLSKYFFCPLENTKSYLYQNLWQPIPTPVKYLVASALGIGIVVVVIYGAYTYRKIFYDYDRLSRDYGQLDNQYRQLYDDHKELAQKHDQLTHNYEELNNQQYSQLTYWPESPSEGQPTPNDDHIRMSKLEELSRGVFEAQSKVLETRSEVLEKALEVLRDNYPSEDTSGDLRRIFSPSSEGYFEEGLTTAEDSLETSRGSSPESDLSRSNLLVKGSPPPSVVEGGWDLLEG